MSVRILALFLFVLLLPPSTFVCAAAARPAEAPAIELSEAAEAALAVEQSAADAGDGAAAAEAAQGGAVQAAESGVLQRPEAAPAAEGSVVDAAPLAAPVADQAPVPWWREVASRLGLAPDPRPGDVAVPAPGTPAASQQYVIGSGDVLTIAVWRDENLTRSVVVLPDGKISFPLVGELVAGGKTVTQLNRELKAKLARYVSDVGLTVEVKQSNSMIIYIIGRVNAPGRQVMLDSTNVLQALAMAGGLNPFADRGAVRVFRRQGGKTLVFPFDYDEVAEGRHLENNIELQRGDVVIVP